MEKSSKKTNAFVEGVVAILKGADSKATGEKILRQADSAFKAQIASLTGDTISLEDKVEDAEEALRLARLNNGRLISDRNHYISALLDAKNNLTAAQEELDAHNAKLAFLNEQADLLS